MPARRSGRSLRLLALAVLGLSRASNGGGATVSSPAPRSPPGSGDGDEVRPHCQAVMDLWCGTLTSCVAAAKVTGARLPLVAHFGPSSEWSCFSPGPGGGDWGTQLCPADAPLRQVLGICNGTLPAQPYPLPKSPEVPLPPSSAGGSEDPAPSILAMPAGAACTCRGGGAGPGPGCYRIPSLVGFGADSPALLLFAQERDSSCADAEAYSLVYTRSIDGGRSWQKIQYLFNDTAAAKLQSDGINSISSVYDPQRKAVHVMFTQCANGFGTPPCGPSASLLVISSNDFGVEIDRPF